MDSTRLRRGIALFTSAALLATMTAATVASPASAAKPKCQGVTATIVGTRKADRIIGTSKRDVIVAKGGADKVFGRGGNDLICGGPGNDRLVGQGGIDKLIGGAGADKLYGGPGPDRLFAGPGPDLAAGQLGNDVIDGGIGVDTCFQNTGSGPVVRCEKPLVVPPEPPTLVIAYADVNTNHEWDDGDIMISEIVDTNEDGVVSGGDTIRMGQYPTTPFAIIPAAVRQTFESWGTSHTVAPTGINVSLSVVRVESTSGSEHEWYTDASVLGDTYFERDAGDTAASFLIDDPAEAAPDQVAVDADSPSKPERDLSLSLNGKGDDGFIDVKIYVS